MFRLKCAQFPPFVFILVHLNDLLPLSQIQLGPNFLQSFLSCARSLQGRNVRHFLQPFPSHRYENRHPIPEMG